MAIMAQPLQALPAEHEHPPKARQLDQLLEHPRLDISLQRQLLACLVSSELVSGNVLWYVFWDPGSRRFIGVQRLELDSQGMHVLQTDVFFCGDEAQRCAFVEILSKHVQAVPYYLPPNKP